MNCCNQGRAYQSRQGLVRSSRIVLSYFVVLLVLMAIASTAFIAMHQEDQSSVSEVTA